MHERRMPPFGIHPLVADWEPLPTRLQYGYDIINSAGVFDGHYIRCRAAEETECSCHGCRHDGQIPGMNARIVERRATA